MIELADRHKPTSATRFPGLPFPGALVSRGACFRPVTFGRFRISLFSREGSDRLIESIALEIGKRYPETGEPYAREIIALSDGYSSSLSRKLILGCYISQELLGFTVATPKPNNKVKFGPTIVLPHARGYGIASLLRSAGESHFAHLGFAYAYSTCREDNAAARSYVVKSNYCLVGRLEGQYSPGVAELVYTKLLAIRPAPVSVPPVFAVNGFSNSPFSLHRKRGGAAKIELSRAIFRSHKQFAECLEYAVQSAQRGGIRRVYLKIPAYPLLIETAERLALRVESLDLPDHSSARGVVLARSFER
jgi:ribosomal protein S18 acetylase RimI-like enzyme